MEPSVCSSRTENILLIAFLIGGLLFGFLIRGWFGGLLVFGDAFEFGAGDDGDFGDVAEAGDAVVAFAVFAAEFFEDFGVVALVLGFAFSVAGAAHLAAVADVFVES